MPAVLSTLLDWQPRAGAARRARRPACWPRPICGIRSSGRSTPWPRTSARSCSIAPGRSTPATAWRVVARYTNGGTGARRAPVAGAPGACCCSPRTSIAAGTTFRCIRRSCRSRRKWRAISARGRRRSRLSRRGRAGRRARRVPGSSQAGEPDAWRSTSTPRESTRRSRHAGGVPEAGDARRPARRSRARSGSRADRGAAELLALRADADARRRSSWRPSLDLDNAPARQSGARLARRWRTLLRAARSARALVAAALIAAGAALAERWLQPSDGAAARARGAGRRRWRSPPLALLRLAAAPASRRSADRAVRRGARARSWTTRIVTAVDHPAARPTAATRSRRSSSQSAAAPARSAIDLSRVRRSARDPRRPAGAPARRRVVAGAGAGARRAVRRAGRAGRLPPAVPGVDQRAGRSRRHARPRGPSGDDCGDASPAGAARSTRIAPVGDARDRDRRRSRRCRWCAPATATSCGSTRSSDRSSTR